MAKSASDVKQIKIDPGNNECLHRSATATLLKMVSLSKIIEDLRKNNYDNVQLRHMGGRFVLLTCANKDIRDKLVQEKWFQKWFGDVKKWNGEAASIERFAWVDLVGLPLDVWSLKTFKSIGELWGHFISASNDTLSDSSFSKASMLVATNAKNKIDEWIWVEVQGRDFEVRAVEGRVIVNNGHGENSEQFNGKEIYFLSKQVHVDHKDVVVVSQADSSSRVRIH
ncbi:hypothetical protein Vadar_000700 [Vaccinium darrowii]|uniref:Uncharacterized protein n=1 Tax=Vaccinium darrowii TaxID=229202 RepID=A0ACB7Z2Q3_9ERIC|nr:hypothetical protein Vadar_000700 [Vaccinium darrowii]